MNEDRYKKLAREQSLPFPVVINGKGKATTYHVHVASLASWIDKVKEVAAKDHLAAQA